MQATSLNQRPSYSQDENRTMGSRSKIRLKELGSLENAIHKSRDHVRLLNETDHPLTKIDMKTIFNHHVEESFLAALALMPVQSKPTTTHKENIDRVDCLEHLLKAVHRIDYELETYGDNYINKDGIENPLKTYLTSLKNILEKLALDINSNREMTVPFSSSFPSATDMAHDLLLSIVSTKENSHVTIVQLHLNIGKVLDAIALKIASGASHSDYDNHLKIVLSHWKTRLTSIIA